MINRLLQSIIPAPHYFLGGADAMSGWSDQNISNYIDALRKPRPLRELLIPGAIQAGTGILSGLLARGGQQGSSAEQQRLADLYAGREWNAQNYEAQLAHQLASGIGATQRRLQHAGLDRYAQSRGLELDPTLYVPPALPQTFQTAYQDARGMGVSPLAGTELDTSGRGGGGGWKKWLPIAAMAAPFIPGVGPALGKVLPALGALFGLGGGGGITGGPESWNPGITGPIIPSGSLPPWNPPSRGIQY
jgi:hypothetical protein